MPLPFADWLSNAREFAREFRKDRDAAVRHMAGVFYPDAELPGQVDPWLNRDHGTGGNRTGGRGSKQRRLVNRQTHPMAKTVGKQLIELRLREDFARDGIELRHLNSRHERCSGRAGRCLHDLVDSHLAVSWFPTNDERAGAICVVAVVHCAKVNLEEVACSQCSGPRDVMGYR